MDCEWFLGLWILIELWRRTDLGDKEEVEGVGHWVPEWVFEEHNLGDGRTVHLMGGSLTRLSTGEDCLELWTHWSWGRVLR